MSNFNRPLSDTNVHFSKSLMGEVESSRMTATPTHITTFNAGDIVPLYCREILPNESVSMDLDYVVRQTTLLTPTMGSMEIDIYAFFVPNRIVNQSWNTVMGENVNGSWTAPQVALAPLLSPKSTLSSIQVPVGSVADYYGFPTQRAIPSSVLKLCNDLKFRGYVMIYNEHFRDQNYQPPIPMSTLNVYQGFFDHNLSNVTRLGFDASYASSTGSRSFPSSQPADNSFGAGAVAQSLYGNGQQADTTYVSTSYLSSRFDALAAPLKANKLHDYFTSVLPSPQKASSSVFSPVTGQINSVPIVTVYPAHNLGSDLEPLLFVDSDGAPITLNSPVGVGAAAGLFRSGSTEIPVTSSIVPSNLSTQSGAEVIGLGLSINDVRMASAVQQVYEILARGGSRYREITASFFGIEGEDPYSNIPQCLGKVSKVLDLYQTAQTSASETGNTAQGNLAAFGYTSGSNHLFSNTFLEHGYLHVLGVVRHRNIYGSYMSRDNFRLNMLDFYFPSLANISEQPVFTYQINPFASNPENAFGYQEAWAEYRFEPDMVSGYMRPGISESLSLWNYADDFDASLQIANGTWLRSNSQSVLDRTLAVTSSVSPQLKGMFKFYVDKVLPMPTYSVPGLDIL